MLDALKPLVVPYAPLVADRSREPKRYEFGERRPVWVQHSEDGCQYGGVLHAWLPALPAPAWYAVVSYHVGVGLQHYVVVPSSMVELANGFHHGARPDPGDESEEPLPCPFADS
jgi:hypothetical protein